jgi:phosphate starvation-inducible protein PhoH and related proteins
LCPVRTQRQKGPCLTLKRRANLNMKRKRAQAAALQSNVINIDPRFDQKRKRVQIYPKNLSQETYLLKLNDPQKMIIFAIGPAGTGKTMLAVQWAIDQLKYGDAEKIIITRPAVSVDEQHGFLPGDLNQKMEPWTKPIMDVFAENYNAKELENMIREGVIETSPLAYMRGRTFKNAVVIADEMQNATPSQMKMLLTRLGIGSKMVVTGDLQQADRPSNNGLLEFLGLYNDFKNHRYVDLCHFTVGDVERHEAVKEILAIYRDS